MQNPGRFSVVNTEILSYSPHRSRRVRLITVAVMLISLAAIGAVGLRSRAAGSFLDGWKYSYQWKKALNFQTAQDAVAYEEEPSRAKILLQDRDYHIPGK